MQANASPALLDLLPITARHVLAVGADADGLLAAHVARNPMARGLALDGAGLLAVQTALTDPAWCPPGCAAPVMFDAIVADAALAVLADPWAMLGHLLRWLAPDGVLLLHWPNRSSALHLHRMLRHEDDPVPAQTLGAAQRALDRFGLVADRVVVLSDDTARACRLAELVAPALAELGVEPAEFLARSNEAGRIWRCGFGNVVPLRIRSTRLDPIGGVSAVRVHQPLRALATLPGLSAQILPTPFAPEAPDDAQILLLHRPALVGANGLAWLRRQLRRDVVVVTEFDDNPDFLPAMQGGTIYCFSGVHAVQTSTPALHAQFRAINPETQIFTNAIDVLPAPPLQRPQGRLRILFAALNRETEWQPYIGVLNNLIRLYPDRLAFHVVADEAMFRSLNTMAKDFTPLCDYDAYLSILAACDVSFMPLRDNAFNRCKSDLKFIEAAAHGVVALASPTVYAATIRSGETGMLFADAGQLRSNIVALLEQQGLAQRIGMAGRDYVCRHRMLAWQTARRAAWYRSLWQRRDTLRAAALARVPGLAGLGPISPGTMS